MAEHTSSSSVACCTSVQLPTPAATPSPSPPWISPSLHLSFQPWMPPLPSTLISTGAHPSSSFNHGRGPLLPTAGRRGVASYTSCDFLVLALALGHGAAAATTLLRVAPSTCSMKYRSELQLDLHSPCTTSQTPLVVDVVLRASRVRRKSQVHGQHMHNSNPIGQIV
uniref:Uncharacterized protein n=1 Tax=Zea mays TaxID=4577 RepID=B6TT38_MAIZE|nr:hypothetical protein [Zea mays]